MTIARVGYVWSELLAVPGSETEMVVVRFDIGEKLPSQVVALSFDDAMHLRGDLDRVLAEYERRNG